jgi:nucleoside-diphosphate-sugar epimerase
MTLACFIAHGCELLWTVIGRHPPVSSYRVRSAYAPLTFDSRRAREELGWQPRVKSGAALRALFPAAGAHGPTAGVGERA